MTTESPVPHDAPVMVAWTAYKQTEEYANTLRWVNTEHSKGSLWAAFEQGFRAAKDAGPPGPSEGESPHLRIAEIAVATMQERVPALDAYGEDEIASFEASVAMSIRAEVQALYRKPEAAG